MLSDLLSEKGKRLLRNIWCDVTFFGYWIVVIAAILSLIYFHYRNFTR